MLNGFAFNIKGIQSFNVEGFGVRCGGCAAVGALCCAVLCRTAVGALQWVRCGEWAVPCCAVLCCAVAQSAGCAVLRWVRCGGCVAVSALRCAVLCCAAVGALRWLRCAESVLCCAVVGALLFKSKVSGA